MIGFLVCTISSPSINLEWNGIFLQPNLTIASIMACRLFREIKLGVFNNPINEGIILNIVFRDIGTVFSQHRLEMHNLELSTVGNKQGDWGELGCTGGHGDPREEESE